MLKRPLEGLDYHLIVTHLQDHIRDKEQWKKKSKMPPSLNTLPGTMNEASAEVSPRRFLKTRAAAGRRKRWLMSQTLGWPLFDPISSWMLRRLYLPSSRLWAAAHLAEGSLQRFCDAVPMPRRIGNSSRLEAALARFDRARVAAAAIETEWQRVFFGPEDISPAYRSAVEAARLDATHAYYAARKHFAFLIGRNVPAINLEIESPESVAQIYGNARDDFAPFVAMPNPMPEVQVSRAIRSSLGKDYWLRFKSPSSRLGDTVYARVHEPQGVIDPPTIIYGHGVCVEFDHWRGLIEETYNLCAAGFRVIRPEAPWHGRRQPRGFFGGERLMAVFPTGSIDALSGAVREWAVLADWSRKTSRGTLSFGGTSLGALTAQLAADRAHKWEERLRPEGLFLITHSASMTDIVMQGEISKLFDGTETAKTKGWTIDTLSAYFRLLDPSHSPPVAPDKIVTLLGKRDTVTPFNSALPLVQSWGVPKENMFVWDRGHFSVPMTLIRDQRPIRRFCAVMGSTDC